MKNTIKLSCIALFILIFASVWAFRSEASKSANFDSNFIEKSASRTLYLNNCARCHGADGRGDTELGRLNDSPDISGGKAKKLSSKYLSGLITKGKGSMPGFGKKMTKAQISSLARYVKSL